MSLRNEDDFIDLVQQAEQIADTNPKAYTRRLTLFALLGYLVIFLVLITLIGLSGGLVASLIYSSGIFFLLFKKKLIFGLIIAIWVLLRALWVKFTPPTGYKLKRKEFPELFAELDSLSSQLKSLKIHEVILDRNLNAAVLQHPRLGVLGWHKNYLILGYPLLLTLSPEEMRSVLAHEFGHLSGNHSRFGGWIYRVRKTWLRVMSAFRDTNSLGGKLMHKFFNWYSPRFEAYSFAYARSNEYEADAISAKLTSPEIATRALVNIHVTAPYIEESYWENYFNSADDHKKPPYAPFQGLSTFLKDNPLAKGEILKRIKAEMAVKTHYADTHPSLKDRVIALAARPQLPSSPSINAADSWLGKNNQQVMDMFDEEWMFENSEAWEQRHEYVLNSKQSLIEMAQKKTADLDDEALWNYAFLSNEFKTSSEALPLFREFQERHPTDPDAAFFVGLALLKQNDDEGLNQLRIARDRTGVLEQKGRIERNYLIGYEADNWWAELSYVNQQTAYAGYNYLSDQGKEGEADKWWKESIYLNEVYAEAQEERSDISTSDELETPRINREVLERLFTQLGNEKALSKVWLAQKAVSHFPENPVYIIAFTTKGLNFWDEKIQQSLADKLDIGADVFVVCKTRDTKSIAKKVIKAGEKII